MRECAKLDGERRLDRLERVSLGLAEGPSRLRFKQLWVGGAPKNRPSTTNVIQVAQEIFQSYNGFGFNGDTLTIVYCGEHLVPAGIERGGHVRAACVSSGKLPQSKRLEARDRYDGFLKDLGPCLHCRQPNSQPGKRSGARANRVSIQIGKT